MDRRHVFGKKIVPNQQRRADDRFVRSRDSLEDIIKRRSWSAGSDTDDTVNIWQIEDRQQKRYKSYLDEAFGLDTRRQKSRREAKLLVQTWPCKPRTRSYLSSADSILDLPTYNYAAFPDLLDWSCDDVLVAALGSKYYKFCWSAQSVVGQGLAKYPIQCCKFDPKGRLLLIGTNSPKAELHHNSRTKYANSVTCPCVNHTSPCSITAIDWSPTGNSFVIGCSRGVISAFDRRTVHIITSRQTTTDPIHTVRVSPDTRYIAVSYYTYPYVNVLQWPSLKYYCRLDTAKQASQTLTWHPWRSALLAVGVMSPDVLTTVSLLETPSIRLRETFHLKHCSLDAMLFSHRTGELVLSLWNSEIAGSQLVVMSDPHTVVDQSKRNKLWLNRVRTMVFSPDGSKLATVTADEDLIIWNFFPEEKKVTKNRRFSAIPEFIDEVTNGFVLR